VGPRRPQAGRCSRSASALPLRHAIALGALHGPAELLPVSSSAHVTLIPWLLGWPYPDLDPELRKAFEVVLHTGTAAALLVGLRGEVGEALRGFDLRRLVLVAGSFGPPAIVGLALERPIERRLGRPRRIAGGLLAGAAAMAIADLRGGQERRREQANALDALALGLAQACALVPGASRNGMTLAAARARGFAREDASVLSRHVALPVIVGATALKGTRLARRGLARPMRLAFVAGTAASFASTLASTWIVARVDRGRSPLPYAAYRAALACAVLVRGRPNGPRSCAR
jgi:undecaprenyl-diphosphatase